MKKSFSDLALIFFCAFRNEKSKIKNLTVYHEDGIRFWLIINGVKKNDHPKSEVLLIGIKEDYIKVGIIFEDQRIEHINRMVKLDYKFAEETQTIMVIKQRSKTKASMSYLKCTTELKTK